MKLFYPSSSLHSCLQGCYQILVSLKSWQGQPLSLNPCLGGFVFGSSEVMVIRGRFRPPKSAFKSVFWALLKVLLLRDDRVEQNG